MTPVPAWVEAVVAALLVLSGVFALVSAVGFVRLPGFFLRMHPPALAYTLASWCVALAAAVYFSALQSRPALHPLLVPALLFVTVPVTTVLLARVALFRKRLAGADAVPPTLAPRAAEAGDAPRPEA